MIYTITLNPSIDYYIEMDSFTKGIINSVDKTEYFPGGKGINVSIILRKLNMDSIALGFVGGPYGDLFTELLSSFDITSNFTKIKGNTRQNIKIRGTEETDLNSKGPVISNQEVNEFLKSLSKITPNDTVVLSGKPPQFEDNNQFENILKKIKLLSPKLIIDMAGDNLRHSLSNNPYLIKPNKEEFLNLIGKTNLLRTQLVNEAQLIINQGLAQNILLSLGANGALFITNQEVYNCPASPSTVVDTVGAGDTLLAGFIYAMEKGYNHSKQLNFASQAAAKTIAVKHLPQDKELQKIEV